MLIGIAPCVGPDLLSVLYRMGHGDEIVLADAFFPGESCNSRVIRADGSLIPDLLDGILRLICVDRSSAESVMMMAQMEGDIVNTSVEITYRKIIEERWPESPALLKLERFAFYERARRAFAVVMSGDTHAYGNIIIKKGVPRDA